MNEVVLDLRPGPPRHLVQTVPPLDTRAMLRDRGFAPAASYLAACLALGGAGGGGVLPNAVLQMAAVALLLWCALDRRAPPALPAQRAALGFALALVGLALLQLLPLPPALWSGLPGRGFVREGYAVLGVAPPWLPLTLQPERTVGVLLALLPPLAMLVLAQRLGREARVGAGVLVGAGALGSALLDMIQTIAGGPAFYAAGMAGVFAAPADQAVLMLLALPCLAPAAAREAGRARHDRAARRRLGGLTAAALGIAAALAAMRIAPVLLLLPIALGVAGGIALAPLWRGWRLAGVVAGLVVAGSVAAALAWPGVRAAGEAGNALAAARAFLPWGAGLGTFAALSGTVTPIETLARAAPAHAGSDLAEWLGEAGLVGIALALSFVAWWARQAAGAWRARGLGAPSRQAGAAVAALVLLASIAGAPLRTAALAAVSMLGVALLTDHPRPPEPPRRRRR